MYKFIIMTGLNSNSNVVQNTLESLSLADLNKKYFELRDRTDPASGLISPATGAWPIDVAIPDLPR